MSQQIKEFWNLFKYNIIGCQIEWQVVVSLSTCFCSQWDQTSSSLRLSAPKLRHWSLADYFVMMELSNCLKYLLHFVIVYLIGEIKICTKERMPLFIWQAFVATLQRLKRRWYYMSIWGPFYRISLLTNLFMSDLKCGIIIMINVPSLFWQEGGSWIVLAGLFTWNLNC